MAEEASEALVKLYLEYQGYFVRTNQKFKIPKFVKTAKVKQTQHPNYEIDILAVNLKTKDKIVGEVKGWQKGLRKIHFTKLYHKRHKWQTSLKIVNDSKFRNKILKEIENKYGKGFRLVIFCRKIQKTNENEIRKFSDKNNFKIITMNEILPELYKAKDEFAYSNDSVLQLLRIIGPVQNKKN